MIAFILFRLIMGEMCKRSKGAKVLLQLEALVVLVWPIEDQDVIGLQQSQSLHHFRRANLRFFCVLLAEICEKGLDIGLFGVLRHVGSQDVLDLLRDERDPLFRGSSATSGDDVHVDQASHWVSCRLLRGHFNQVYGFVDVGHLDCAGKAHFGEGLAEPDQGLQLARSSRDRLFVVSQLSHVEVCLRQPPPCLLRDDWHDVVSGIADVFGQGFLPVHAHAA